MNKLNKSICFNALTTLAIAITVFFIILFAGFKGNISGFYRIGNTLKLSPLLTQNDIIVLQGPYGCDGQQFLALALDPLLLNPHTKGTLDAPLYRAKRIMYPLLGYIFGAGSPDLIIYSLTIINFVGLIFLVLIATLWLKQNSIEGRWALIILTIPAIWITLSLSTSEIFCAVFSLSALYYYKKNHVFFTVLFLTLAIFTRETAILVLIVIFFSTVVKKNFRFLIYLLTPLILFLLWNLYLYVILELGEPSFLISQHVSFPFLGVLHKFSSLLNTNKINLVFFFEIGSFFLLLLIIIIGIITAIQNFRTNPELSSIFLLQVLLFTMFRTTILDKFGDYTRVCMEIYLYSFLMLPWSNKFAKKAIPIAAFIFSVSYIIGFLLYI